jgi:serine/threonine protein phosphatase PrpC
MSTPLSEPISVVVSVGVQCDVGRQRTENQDRVTRSATPFGDLFVVADGVGGYQGGGEAAQAVVDGFAKYLVEYANSSLVDALQLSVSRISGELEQRAAKNQDLQGMGSTVVLCIVNGNRATYAHVGDSRLYLLRDRKLQALTRDHSVMERMVSAGILTPEQARDHPDASVLTRALGQGSAVSLDVAEIFVQSEDALLLCSDGLWGYARHEEMEAIANSPGLSPSAVAKALLNLALDGGGGDNISIQFLRFNAQKSIVKPAGMRGLPRTSVIGIAGLAAALSVAVGGLFVWNHNHAPTTADRNAALGGVRLSPPIPAAKTTSTAPGPPAPQTKTKVVVIDPDGTRSRWFDALNKVATLVVSMNGGSAECRALGQATDSILYSSGKDEVAIQVRKTLPIKGATPMPTLAERADALAKCGAGTEIVVLPRRAQRKNTLPETVHTPLGDMENLPELPQPRQ